MDSDTHLRMIPDKSFDEVPHPSVLIVPGGLVPTFKAMGSPAIRSCVRRAADTAEVVGSVCTGALILAAVGLLEGRPATTHWACTKVLERLGAYEYMPPPIIRRPCCAATASTPLPPRRISY